MLWYTCYVAENFWIVGWLNDFSVTDRKGINSALHTLVASIEDLRSMFGGGLSPFGCLVRNILLPWLPKNESLTRIVEKNRDSHRLARLGRNATVIFAVNKHKFVKALHHWGFTHKFHNGLNFLVVLSVFNEFTYQRLRIKLSVLKFFLPWLRFLNRLNTIEEEFL